MYGNSTKYLRMQFGLFVAAYTGIRTSKFDRQVNLDWLAAH